MGLLNLVVELRIGFVVVLKGGDQRVCVLQLVYFLECNLGIGLFVVLEGNFFIGEEVLLVDGGELVLGDQSLFINFQLGFLVRKIGLGQLVGQLEIEVQIRKILVDVLTLEVQSTLGVGAGLQFLYFLLQVVGLGSSQRGR